MTSKITLNPHDHIDVLENAAKRAYKHRPDGYELHDLMSMGYQGLIEACERFDPSKGCPHEDAIQKFKKYGTAIVSLRIIDEIRRVLPYSRNDTIKIKNGEGHKVTKTYNFTTFETMVGICVDGDMGNDSHNVSDIDIFYDNTEFNEQSLKHISSNDFIDLVLSNPRLTDRDRKIMRLRFVEDKTLTECGEPFGISESRVSQLLKKCYDHIRNEIGDNADLVSKPEFV